MLRKRQYDSDDSGDDVSPDGAGVPLVAPVQAFPSSPAGGEGFALATAARSSRLGGGPGSAKRAREVKRAVNGPLGGAVPATPESASSLRSAAGFSPWASLGGFSANGLSAPCGDSNAGRGAAGGFDVFDVGPTGHVSGSTNTGQAPPSGRAAFQPPQLKTGSAPRGGWGPASPLGASPSPVRSLHQRLRAVSMDDEMDAQHAAGNTIHQYTRAAGECDDAGMDDRDDAVAPSPSPPVENAWAGLSDVY